MSKQVNTQAAAPSFRLPPNLRALRDSQRVKIEVAGTVRSASFIHYKNKNTYAVAIAGAGMVLIGQNKSGKWQGVVCEKVAHKTFKTTGTTSQEMNDPKAAFLNVMPAWERKIRAAALGDALM